MSGLVPIDVSVAIASPATGQFTSEAGQSLTQNFNPAFLYGGGSLTNSPSGNPSSSAPQEQVPSLDAPTSATAAVGGAAGTPGQAFIPGTSIPALGAAGGSLPSGTLMLLLIGVALILLFSGGESGGGRRR